MTHVRTSRYYPQSNGKIEAWHKTLKVTTIRRRLRPRSPKLVSLWAGSWSITTRCGCTVPSATSPLPIDSAVASRRSGLCVIASSRLPVRFARLGLRSEWLMNRIRSLVSRCSLLGNGLPFPVVTVQPEGGRSQDFV